MMIRTLLVTAVFALLNPIVGHAAPMILIAPAFDQALLGSTATVNIEISGLGAGSAPSLSSLDINIEFDQNLLEFGALTFGSQLDHAGFGSITAVSATAGVLNIFQLSLDSAAALEQLQLDAFTIATLSFDTLARGASPLILTINALADEHGNALTADTKSGEILVVPQAVAEPPTIALLLTAVFAALLASIRLRRAPFLFPIVGLALASPAMSQVMRTSFAFGDVFVATGNGQVQWRDPSGALIRTLTSASSGFTTGMAFDSASNLYVTNFSQNSISKFDRTGARVGVFSSPTAPESIAFNASGEMYVGHAGSSDITLHANDGSVRQVHTVAIEDRGTDWIDLAADQCSISYTSEGYAVKRYNVCSRTQSADFIAALPARPAYALRLLPDANSAADPRRGGLLVADTQSIIRLDRAGAVVKTYDFPGQDCWFALNLDPDGSSFWSADFCTGTVVKFATESGDVLLSFNSGTGPNTVFGLVVLGEVTLANPILPLTIPVVAVDAGHGTNFAGQHIDRPTPSPTYGLYESDMALAIAFEARTALLANSPQQFQVVSTRADKFLVPLMQRVDVANRLSVNAFVSVHTNANARPTVNGTEVLYNAKHADATNSLRLSAAVQRELVALGLNDRKVKDSEPYIGYVPAVLNYTRMPSAIAEVAFLTNSTLAAGQSLTDEARLNDAEFRVRSGIAIGRGVQEFFK